VSAANTYTEINIPVVFQSKGSTYRRLYAEFDSTDYLVNPTEDFWY